MARKPHGKDEMDDRFAQGQRTQHLKTCLTETQPGTKAIGSYDLGGIQKRAEGISGGNQERQ